MTQKITDQQSLQLIITEKVCTTENFCNGNERKYAQKTKRDSKCNKKTENKRLRQCHTVKKNCAVTYVKANKV